MLSREVWSCITVDDFPDEDIRQVARIIGVENTIRILQLYGGQSLYLPRFWVMRAVVQKWVSLHFNGSNSKQLARDLGVSERTVYRAINKPRVATAEQPADASDKPTKPRVLQNDLFAH